MTDRQEPLTPVRKALEASMNDIGIGTDERLDRAVSRVAAALTPLQREVATEPTCSRCQRDITRLDDLYRCAQCKAAFHLTCIYDHFGWSVNGPADAVAAEHAGKEKS